MGALPIFLLTVLQALSGPDPGRGTMYVVIRAPYAHLERELRRVFEGQDDVRVLVDRRAGERRTSRRSVELERRGAERRRSKAEVVEVVIP